MTAMSRTEKELSRIRIALESIDKSLLAIAKALPPTVVIESPPKQD